MRVICVIRYEIIPSQRRNTFRQDAEKLGPDHSAMRRASVGDLLHEERTISRGLIAFYSLASYGTVLGTGRERIRVGE